MSDSNEATDSVPTPLKRKPGRPKKVTTTPDNSALFELMQQQINSLQAAVAEKQQPTLAPIPAPTAELKPGMYVEVGRDAFGGPILGKIPWTRETIASTYGMTTFVPRRTLRVGPHGVMWDLVADVECTVPGIVRQIHDDQFRDEKADAAKYKAWSAAEDSELTARATEQPGSQQWSRLARIGVGFKGLGADANNAVEPEPVK